MIRIRKEKRRNGHIIVFSHPFNLSLNLPTFQILIKMEMKVSQSMRRINYNISNWNCLVGWFSLLKKSELGGIRLDGQIPISCNSVDTQQLNITLRSWNVIQISMGSHCGLTFKLSPVFARFLFYSPAGRQLGIGCDLLSTQSKAQKHHPIGIIHSNRHGGW